MNLLSKTTQILGSCSKKDTFKGGFSVTGCLVLLFLAFNICDSHAQAAPKKDFKIQTVVIDAGHGGHDPGCLGASVNEKHVCLQVALKLGALIKNYFPDVKVVYTRDTDVFVKLTDRAEIANKNKADLFISIHANSAQNKSAFGTETYVMGTKYTDKNLEISKRENSVIFLEKDYEKNYDGYDPNSPMANILMGLYQQEYLESSINFASKVEHQFEVRNKRHSRGVRQRVLLVMYRTTMPSVLIETGFLTNKDDHDLLASELGVAQTSGAIFRAFLEYKREMEGVPASEIAKEEAKVFGEWDKYLEEVLKIKVDTAFIDSLHHQIAHERDSLSKVIQKHESVEAAKALEAKKPENHDLLFRVQITSSSKKIPLNSRKFVNLPPVFEYESEGTFKYAVGNYVTIEEATEAQSKVREGEYKDAFIIAFYKGERVSMKRAREIIKEGKN